MNIVVLDFGFGEVVVDVIVCGVCYIDLIYCEGGINDEYFFLFGYEVVGIIEVVGLGVIVVEFGDFVILNWCVVCG